jgi:hypothetical protein
MAHAYRKLYQFLEQDPVGTGEKRKDKKIFYYTNWIVIMAFAEIKY